MRLSLPARLRPWVSQDCPVTPRASFLGGASVPLTARLFPRPESQLQGAAPTPHTHQAARLHLQVIAIASAKARAFPCQGTAPSCTPNACERRQVHMCSAAGQMAGEEGGPSWSPGPVHIRCSINVYEINERLCMFVYTVSISLPKFSCSIASVVVLCEGHFSVTWAPSLCTTPTPSAPH